jgi:hypothetical protein
MPSRPDLWRRICEHEPSAGQQGLLREQLAREQGWNRGFAALAIDEYRRFTYLATVAAHPVTPSSVIDQVWQHHLSCSEDYWRLFCPQVLQRPLHRDPGDVTGRVRTATRYQATLALYREEFGPPPGAIWEAGRTRIKGPAWPGTLGAGMLFAGAALATGASSSNASGDWIAVGALALLASALWSVVRSPAS